MQYINIKPSPSTDGKPKPRPIPCRSAIQPCWPAQRMRWPPTCAIAVGALNVPLMPRQATAKSWRLSPGLRRAPIRNQLRDQQDCAPASADAVVDANPAGIIGRAFRPALCANSIARHCLARRPRPGFITQPAPARFFPRTVALGLAPRLASASPAACCAGVDVITKPPSSHTGAAPNPAASPRQNGLSRGRPAAHPFTTNQTKH